jgi:hypothetical protein
VRSKCHHKKQIKVVRSSTKYSYAQPMSFKKPRPAEMPEPLAPEKAQLESRMLRVKLAELVGREPTTEDYDKALQAVEEVKQLAEGEPQFDKLLYELLRIGNKYFNDAADGLLWIFTLGARPNELDKVNREDSLEMFRDAAARLEDLKRKAEIEP